MFGCFFSLGGILPWMQYNKNTDSNNSNLRYFSSSKYLNLNPLVRCNGSNIFWSPCYRCLIAAPLWTPKRLLIWKHRYRFETTKMLSYWTKLNEINILYIYTHIRTYVIVIFYQVQTFIKMSNRFQWFLHFVFVMLLIYDYFLVYFIILFDYTTLLNV